METSRSQALARRRSRREFLKKSAGAVLGAVASFGVLRRARAAEPVNIGGLYRKGGQIERAIEAFRAAVRADRRHVIARFQLAACLHDSD